MANLYIIIKTKGSNRYIGVIPAKKKATPSKLLKHLRPRIKKGFSFKIVTARQVKNIITKQRPRHRNKRRIRKKR